MLVHSVSSRDVLIPQEVVNLSHRLDRPEAIEPVDNSHAVLLDHVIADGGKAESEEAPALLLLQLFRWAEDRSWRNEDAVVFGGQVDPEGFCKARVGDLVEERVGGEVDAHPEEHASHGVGEVVHLGFGYELEVFGDCFGGVSFFLVDLRWRCESDGKFASSRIVDIFCILLS